MQLSLCFVLTVAGATSGPRESFFAAEAAARVQDWPEAARLFIAAFKEAPHANAAYNAAQALLRADEPARALTWLDEAARARGADRLPDLEAQRRTLASVFAEAGGAPWLRLHSVPIGAAVSLDDRPLGETPLMARVAAGPHLLRATVEGAELRRELLLSAGTSTEVWLIPHRRGGTSIVGGALVAGALGAVGAGIAVGLGAHQSSTQLRGAIHPQAEAQQLFDAARDQALLANVLFGAAVVLAGGGTGLLWYDGGSR